MLTQALLAAAEQGLNQVLRLDGTALPRLARLQGKVIEISCTTPPVQLFLLPGADGLQLASHWLNAPDCQLRAPAAGLLRLAFAADKSSLLHRPEVSLHGDSGVLLELAAILQELELDWEYELSRWLGPVASQLLGSHLRSRLQWTGASLDSLRLSLADFLAEESRALVGRREAEARFAELDQLKLALDRLDARVGQIAHKVTATP